VSASGYQLLPTTNTAPIDEPYSALKLINGSTFPYSPAASGRVGLIRITGTYGWAAVPVEVKQARFLLGELGAAFAQAAAQVSSTPAVAAPYADQVSGSRLSLQA
jgi:hypothetical protein